MKSVLVVVGVLVLGCGWLDRPEAAPVPACLDIGYKAKPRQLHQVKVGEEVWCPTYSLSMDKNGDKRLYVNDTCTLTYKDDESVRLRKVEGGYELDVSSVPEGLVVQGSDIIGILDPIVGYYKHEDIGLIWDTATTCLCCDDTGSCEACDC
jgi:hypothetical protein